MDDDVVGQACCAVAKLSRGEREREVAIAIVKAVGEVVVANRVVASGRSSGASKQQQQQM